MNEKTRIVIDALGEGNAVEGMPPKAMKKNYRIPAPPRFLYLNYLLHAALCSKHLTNNASCLQEMEIIKNRGSKLIYIDVAFFY